MTGARPTAPRAKQRYFALKVREGIYFVDFVAHETPPTAISLVLDLERGIATSLVARLPDSPDVGQSLAARIAAGLELTAVTATFSSAAVDAPFTADDAAPSSRRRTSSAAGWSTPTARRSATSTSISTSDFYTWHCLLGSEKGLADTDRCHYFKLGDELYLFVWREKIIPTLGAVVADFAAMRTMGKIFGHAQDGSGGLVGLPGRRTRATAQCDLS